MEFPNYRLFDAVRLQLEKFPKTDMLNAKSNGSWKGYSTQEVDTLVNRFSAGLRRKGISGNNFTADSSDKVAIISQNRPEWIFTDLAVQQLGAVLVPIYPTTNPLELEFILNDAQAKIIFVADAALLEKVNSVIGNVPSITNVYTFDEIAGSNNYRDLLVDPSGGEQQELDDIKKSVPNTHTATIIYTSGTTGTPKGVMLSHANIFSNIYFSRQSFPFPDAPDQKVLSFLPLNHIFEKMVTYIYLFSGISIYYAESMETIADNLREVKPDGFTTVPRLLEKVYERIMGKGNELKGIKRALFFWSVGLGLKYETSGKSAFYNFQLGIARKLVFSKWREALGGKISFIITGGAAASSKLLRIFTAAGIPVYEGYGPTENSPVICVNRKGDPHFGTVGPPIDGVEVKLAEDGEILTRSASVMQGYYKRPDLTAETMRDGWLLTGDIGVFEGKNLKITDRKKELFKTSGGKYVAPQPIENKMKESRLIEQILVVGAGEKFVGALIVPSMPMLKEWMKEHDLAFTTKEDAICNPEVLKLMRETVDKYNENFNHVEQIKKFELLCNEWSVDTGEMTPKLSMKRKVIMEKFRDNIGKIYAAQ
ncbi:MAG: long-chain fatty acid--CoA ligase [Chitinophagaceae bacterium]|nr:MAG: long-chain fatty acid--CoA ligase [Chitinophagaceae bacterium]